MATFIINTKTELWKCRKTAAYWITIIGSAFIPLFLMVAYISVPKEFAGDLGNNPWSNHIKNTWQAAAALFFPFYTIIVTSLVVQIEYRNNTWKQVYASPRSYADIFFSKFCIIHLLILSCFILFNVFVVGGAFVANTFRSQYKFFDSSIPWERLLSFTGKQYIAILGMTAMQYWLSLRLKNYIAPLGIGLALVIIGIIILPSSKVIYYPYAYTAVTFFKNKGSNGLADHEIYSLVWFGVILALAFWDTSKRKERG
jgi:lantibiotic transport system permease protein